MALTLKPNYKDNASACPAGRLPEGFGGVRPYGVWGGEV